MMSVCSLTPIKADAPRVVRYRFSPGAMVSDGFLDERLVCFVATFFFVFIGCGLPKTFQCFTAQNVTKRACWIAELRQSYWKNAQKPRWWRTLQIAELRQSYWRGVGWSGFSG